MKRFILKFTKLLLTNAADKRKRGKIQCAASTKLAAESQFSIIGSRESLQIGEGCIIYGIFETFDKDAHIIIGDHVFIGPQTRIWSHKHINIGNRVLIAHGVNIIDSNSHSTSAAERHEEYLGVLSSTPQRPTSGIATGAIVINDDAWIGLGSVLLKGVTIGRGAIVAAGAVVTRDVGDFSIVGGNPATVIGSARP